MVMRERQKEKELEMRVIEENEKQKGRIGKKVGRGWQMISIYYKNISRSPALGLELHILWVYNMNKSPPTSWNLHFSK